MISIVLAGRNDNYGGDFEERLFRTCEHNIRLMMAVALDFEFVLAEWNPLPDRPLLSVEFLRRVPKARTVVIPPRIHQEYSLNPHMPFYEMPAKNAAIRRARGEGILVTNADVLFGEDIVEWLRTNSYRTKTLYRAHRIDVPQGLSWAKMKDPANHLPSGEGSLVPCSYLGAGGDFCFASRSLWHSLRGFDERVRFSTRAKDWQFFLSAEARGVAVQFIGTVYHLEHEGGFRNSSRQDLRSPAVHFGSLWDIEFGLPTQNPDDWGFGSTAEKVSAAGTRIVELEANEPVIPASRDAEDRLVRDWITSPPNGTAIRSAEILHAIYTAWTHRRRLICRLQNPRSAVALSGLAVAAGSFEPHIYCNWEWPSVAGYQMRRFLLEPPELIPEDWILEELEENARLVEYGTNRIVAFGPLKHPIRNPGFNPVFGRRLLRAYMRLYQEGSRRIALYGGGSHTDELLRWGVPDDFEVVSVVVTSQGSGELWSVPVVSVRSTNLSAVDAVVLSSVSYETEMKLAAERLGVRSIIALYDDWPRDIWKAATVTVETSRDAGLP